MTEHETETQLDAADLSAGAWLAQVRRDHKLSVADVAAKLRLAPRQIEAIEADDYERLPGRTIVRGFVRNYARLLQLDPAQVVAAYDKTVPDEGNQRISLPHQNVQFTEVDSGHRNRLTLWLTLGLGILVVFGFIAWWWEAKTAPAPKSSTSAVIVTQAADNAPPFAVSAVDSVPVASESPAVSDSAQAKTIRGTTTAMPQIGSAPASIADNVAHLAFRGPSWVEARAARGTVVWKKSNAARTEQDIIAPLPLTFIIGNAAKVKMTHNGDAFDLTPHIDGGIARFKLGR